MQHHDSDAAKRFARNPEEMRALLPGVALGISTPAENQAVQALLSDDSEAAHELADYRAVAEGMLLSTPAVEPPATALERLLAATGAAAEPELAPQPGMIGRLFAPRWRVSVAAAAAALAVALGVTGYLAAQMNELQRLLSVTQEQTDAIALMREADVGWVKIQNPEEQTDSSPYAWMIYSPGRQSGVILTNNFPPLQQDMAYQLWAAQGDQPVSLGTFRVGNDGTAWYQFWLPERITAFERMGITAEPEAGSPGPTSPAVVRLDLAPFIEWLNGV